MLSKWDTHQDKRKVRRKVDSVGKPGVGIKIWDKEKAQTYGMNPKRKIGKLHCVSKTYYFIISGCLQSLQGIKCLKIHLPQKTWELDEPEHKTLCMQVESDENNWGDIYRLLVGKASILFLKWQMSFLRWPRFYWRGNLNWLRGQIQEVTGAQTVNGHQQMLHWKHMLYNAF